ncbi:MAG: RES family NAD+ phosphorylase [Terracidiphilus sp.]|jgi:RES domain-containing protein
MTTYWRISNHVDLGGWGGEKFSSRWTSLGKRVVYVAESPAGAMLEVLVHFKAKDEKLPRIYTLLRIESPVSLAIRALKAPVIAQWRAQPELTQQIGDAWLASAETLLARVPSAIVPHTWNYLLNPEHPDAAKVQIAEIIKERFDNRLFRFGTR